MLEQIGNAITGFIESMGLLQFFQGTGWQNLVMILISLVLIYLAVVRKFEPMLLLPIAFGMLMVNLPLSGVMDPPIYEVQNGAQVLDANGNPVVKQVGGLFYYLYQGVKLGIYPPLIFMGVGAMTDFGPLIANPKSLLLGAAAQMGIFVAFFLALFCGFNLNEAASIGIIGGADGPTAIYTTTRLAPHLLSAIAVAA